MMDKEIVASIIEASGMVVAAIITVAGLYASSKVIWTKKALQKRLAEAYHDIIVLQHVESVHIEMEIARSGKSNQRMVRDLVNTESGMRVSGNNSPAQVKRKLDRLSDIED